MGSKNTRPRTAISRPTATAKTTALPRFFRAPASSRRPRKRLYPEAQPMPMRQARAVMRVNTGKATLAAAMARSPIPQPMKVWSTMLFMELTTWLQMAGREKVQMSLFTGAVSRAGGRGLAPIGHPSLFSQN